MKVFINPGHAPNGQPDPGAVNTTTGLRESDVAYNVGQTAAKYLVAAGIETQVLQDDDLGYICMAANDSGADLFVSIHCNAADNPQALGTETYYHPVSPQGKKLAQTIQNQLVHSLHMVNRGIKEAVPGRNGLYVLNNTIMPSVLVELGFISNDHDEKVLANYQDALARAIARGVTDYQLLL